MKIAFIGQKGIPASGGGVERYVEDLSTRVAKQGHEAVVYTRAHYAPKNLKTYQGVKLVSLPTVNTKHLDAIVHSVLATLHAVIFGAEVIHYQAIGPALICWLPKLLRPKIKVVSTLQSRDYEHQKWGAFAKFMLLLGEKSMCRFSDEVIVVTRAMEKYAKEKYGIEVRFIPNGANLYNDVSCDKLGQWELVRGNYIVAISRLVRHKGLQYLIQAYKNLGETDKKLVIVGDGAFTDDYAAELKALAKGNDNIIFTGNQSGEVLAQLYANAYLFVQPSESEGLSLALLEAMARRVSVLVSNIDANLEAIGEAGFKFVNKDVADLTEKLRFLLIEEDLVEARGEAGRLRIEKYFNWETIAKEVVKIYEQPVDLACSREAVEQTI